ncbi:MAG: penicillin acylase family protein [Bacillota bacterium]|nr:penicillin acylase family protein [Bacillota bacterium]
MATSGFSGLDGRVEVYRDGIGAAHIRASSMRDAFFAQGYVHASDRLWQMDYDRTRAAGRWAEVAGPKGVPQDRLMRQMRLFETARLDYQGLLPETRAMLDAYSLGVNACIADAGRDGKGLPSQAGRDGQGRPAHAGRDGQGLPLEYSLLGRMPEPWAPWDGLAIYKVRHVMMGVWEAKLWRARLVQHVGLNRLLDLYPDTPEGQLLIVPPGAEYEGALRSICDELARVLDSISWIDEGSGSNNWVVGPSRSSTGKPIVAGDPHRAVDVPNVYYQNHLACDAFDVAGYSFPGLPGFPHFGHNRNVAWCVTHTGADTQDLFVEKMDTQDPSRYLYRGQWLQAEVSRQAIDVRGAEPVAVDVVTTRNGSVLSVAPAPAGSGYALAMRYTATQPGNRGADCIIPMMTATSCDDLEEAMRGWVDPVNNLIYAGTDGSFGYRTRGQIPVRPIANAWLPVPGWTGEHDWQGLIPFEEMPATRNPSSGYVVTANNRVAGKDYPHFISLRFAPDHRARRITHHIKSRPVLGPSDMSGIHADTVSLPAAEFQRFMEAVQPVDDRSRRALELIRQWDGRVDKDSASAAIYNVLREESVKEILRPVLGPLYGEAWGATGRGAPSLVADLRAQLFALVTKDDRRLVPGGATWPEFLSAMLSRAIARLEKLLGPDMTAWKWGEIHQLRPVHPLSPVFPEHSAVLNPPARPRSGDGDTVHAGAYLPVTAFDVTTTSVARYMFDLADWDNSGWVEPNGVSGRPGSEHYTDQTSAYVESRLFPMLYSWDRIRRECALALVLDPSTASGDRK